MLTSRKKSVVVVTLGLSNIMYMLLRSKCQAGKGGMYYYSVIPALWRPRQEDISLCSTGTT